MKKTLPKWTVLRDSSEKADFGWRWNAAAACAGTDVVSLEWADYTLRGFEDIFLVERKLSSAELYHNLIGEDYKRFRKELVALNEIKHAYIVCEFTLSDLFGFPWSEPKIPKSVKYKMQTGEAVYYRVTNLHLKYPNIRWEFAGRAAKQVVTSLFKRMSALYPERLDASTI